jgi:hypothetical protein
LARQGRGRRDGSPSRRRGRDAASGWRRGGGRARLPGGGRGRGGGGMRRIRVSGARAVYIPSYPWTAG